jgi:hypothetical protein
MKKKRGGEFEGFLLLSLSLSLFIYPFISTFFYSFTISLFMLFSPRGGGEVISERIRIELVIIPLI